MFLWWLGICQYVVHKYQDKFSKIFFKQRVQKTNIIVGVATPLWVKCEDETHTPKSGNLESSGTPENSKLEFRGQNTSHWCVLYTIGKVLKCKRPKWPCMNHLDICNSSYGQKKGRESNWQFDSRPLKVRNRLKSDVCRRSVTWRWKDLKGNYNIALDLIPIGGLSKKLWMPKVLGVQTGTVSGLLFGSPGEKCHSDVASMESHSDVASMESHSDVASMESCKKYYKGEGGGFPWVRAVVSQASPSCPWLVPTSKGCRMSSNQLVVGFGCMIK
jgi:hypothetical protein